MDLNLVVLAGRLAATPEVRVFEDGNTLTRILVTTRSEQPRKRIDVVPVVVWNDSATGDDLSSFERGDRVWVSGHIQRRFWSDDHSRRSRIEVVAAHVQGHWPEDSRETHEDAAGSPEIERLRPDSGFSQRAGLEGL